MYDPVAVQPMRDEVTNLGFKETRTTDEVEQALKQPGTTLVFINSVCGCAAGAARPALSLATRHTTLPDQMITAFAGNDVDGVRQARAHFTGYAPSSPAFGLIKNGEIVWMLERWQIEGHNAWEIANQLTAAFDEHCTANVAA
jgi:putative YphP/YqiW family bacilliredoxin